jgi:hypothetical protein
MCLLRKCLDKVACRGGGCIQTPNLGFIRQHQRTRSGRINTTLAQLIFPDPGNTDRRLRTR